MIALAGWHTWNCAWYWTDEMLKATEYARSATYVMAFYERIYIAIWSGAPTTESVVILTEGLRTLLKRCPQGVALLTIIEPDAPMPDSPARKAIAASMADYQYSIRAAASVYEGTGFAAAAVRSILTGMGLFIHQPFPMKIFATVDEATGWMVPFLRGPAEMTSESLGKVVESLRPRRSTT